MTDNDLTEPTMAPTDQPTAPTPLTPRLSEGRRLIASTLLAIGLLTVGGVAIVSAASPAPAATGAPTTPGSGGTHNTANCPNM